MCGRFTLSTSAEDLRRRFAIELDELDDTPRYPSFNVCPTDHVLTVATRRDGRRRLTPMRWGFVPFWSKKPSSKLATINARAEDCAESSMYRSAFRRHRCLVLADGYYEWSPAPDGATGTGKQPYWIHRKDGQPFAFAGLYSVWKPKDQPDAPPLFSCTILTTPADPLVAPIHERMPIVLRPENEAAWVDRSLEDPVDVAPLLTPVPADRMDAQPVSRRVNDPKADGPELLQALPR